MCLLFLLTPTLYAQEAPEPTPESSGTSDETLDEVEGESARLPMLPTSEGAGTADASPGTAPSGRSRANLAVSAGFLAASAYANRGINQFGRDQASAAGVFAPSLQVQSGAITAGWTGAFQAYGANQAGLVAQGTGHEQQGFARWSGGTDDVAVTAAVAGFVYPFADPDASGGALPVWVEPSVSATVGSSLAATATLTHSQSFGAWAGSGYTYGQLGLARTVNLDETLSASLSGVGGAKWWLTGGQGGRNTFDADLAWSLTWTGPTVSLSPSGHLVWTNLRRGGLGDEVFAWLGLSTAMTL